MANRNECFSDRGFSKQKKRQRKMAFLSFPYGLVPSAAQAIRMGDREEYLETPLPIPSSLYGRLLARSYDYVITRFSRLDELPIFLTHGASMARFAH